MKQLGVEAIGIFSSPLSLLKSTDLFCIATGEKGLFFERLDRAIIEKSVIYSKISHFAPNLLHEILLILTIKWVLFD